MFISIQAWIQIGLSIFLIPLCTYGHDPGFHEYAPAHDDYINHETPKDYSFSYGVKDYHSGDVKHHWEKKDGDKVTGQYSLLESDGSVRTVDYTADKAHGFNAVVKHSGHSRHPLTDKDKLPTSHNEIALKPLVNHQTVLEPQAIPPNHRPEYSQEPQYEWKYIYPDEEGYEEALAASKLEEAHLTSYQASQEDSNHNYYLNQGEIAQESQRSTVASKFPHNDVPQIEVKPRVTSKEAPPRLPVDLNLLKPDNAEKIVPVDVSVVDPVEFDVKDQTKYSVKDTVVQQSHELSQEELSRFLQEYYKANKVNSEPQLEQGFQPVRSNVRGVTQPIPGTFDSRKKPVTTPGLSTFSSKKQAQLRLRGNSYRKLPKVKPNLHRQHYRYFTPINEEVREGRHQMSRLYRSIPNSGYVRYAKEMSHGK